MSPQVPYPLSADDLTELKHQIWELIRNLYEDRVAGLDIGDVFEDTGDVLTLRLYALSGLEKISHSLSVNLDGSSLLIGAEGIKVGQSSHITDPSSGGNVDAEARAAIALILDLLEQRGLMAT